MTQEEFDIRAIKIVEEREIEYKKHYGKVNNSITYTRFINSPALERTVKDIIMAGLFVEPITIMRALALAAFDLGYRFRAEEDSTDQLEKLFKGE